ncbi:MAG: hypothetical protein ACRDMJ_16215 [Solirubrobacteraceae bacterium]
MADRRNSYFAVFDDDAVPWDPHDPEDLPLPDCAYFGGVFRELERRWDGPPLTVFMTKDTTWLPRYGADVVSVLLNEEWFRTPAYTDAVRAVARNLPGRPWFPWSTMAPPSAGAAFALANHARILAERARAQRRAQRIAQAKGWPAPGPGNTIDVPLGYFRQPARAVRPLSERATDVYFGGSLVHDAARGPRWKRAAKRTVGNPKLVARRQMLRELQRVRFRHPRLRARVTLSGEFRELGAAQVGDYATEMMDARIALVPRGTAAESYRLFEAWRYGCVAVCEPLPPRWFLDGAPVVTVRSWRELEPTLVGLLNDPSRLRSLHLASLRWWETVCGEAAVAGHLAARLHAAAP